MIHRLLREPFLHFLVLGALVFAVHAWFRDPAAVDSRSIVIDPAVVESIRARLQAQQSRPPSQAELLAELKNHVHQEILYRAGLELGLDRDDTIVKRRIVQKMQFLAADLAEAEPISEVELKRYYDEHPKEFFIGRKFTLQQVFFSAAAHQGKQLEVARQAADKLRSEQVDIEALSAQGSPSLLPARLVDVDRTELEKTFGKRFASVVAELEAPATLSPIESDYGAHVVVVSAVKPAGRLPFTLAKKDILVELEHTRRQAAEERLYQRYRGQYEVLLRDVALPGLEPSEL